MGGEHALLSPADETCAAVDPIPRSERPDSALAPRASLDGTAQADVTSSLTAVASEGDDPLADDHPLEGARFANLTAPGPTLTRAEHAKECLGIKQRPVANRLARAMLRVQNLAKSGGLAPEATWLTRTRLIFLKKKASKKPRPVRMGEFLRGAVAERVQRKAAPRSRKVFRSCRQWGNEMPGGAEAMVHWRGLVEELAIAGVLPPFVAFDLDLANMFGTIEWPKIREAV